MRLVINPEKMVIKEAQRTYTYLNLYGYVTDAWPAGRRGAARFEDHALHVRSE